MSAPSIQFRLFVMLECSEIMVDHFFPRLRIVSPSYYRTSSGLVFPFRSLGGGSKNLIQLVGQKWMVAFRRWSPTRFHASSKLPPLFVFLFIGLESSILPCSSRPHTGFFSKAWAMNPRLKRCSRSFGPHRHKLGCPLIRR